MTIDTRFLERCIKTLELGLQQLNEYDRDDIAFDLCRSGIIKEFEIILEQAGRLLKKCLKPYFHSARAVDELYFKDIFRQAGNHGLMTIEDVERWLIYRDNRNDTAHDYGKGFAEQTLTLMPAFIRDAHALVDLINRHDAAAR